MNLPTKTKSAKRNFHRTGKWIEKKTQSHILLCECGAKYIKTRPDQTTCVKCLVKSRAYANS